MAARAPAWCASSCSRAHRRQAPPIHSPSQLCAAAMPLIIWPIMPAIILPIDAHSCAATFCSFRPLTGIAAGPPGPALLQPGHSSPVFGLTSECQGPSVTLCRRRNAVQSPPSSWSALGWHPLARTSRDGGRPVRRGVIGDPVQTFGRHDIAGWLRWRSHNAFIEPTPLMTCRHDRCKRCAAPRRE